MEDLPDRTEVVLLGYPMGSSRFDNLSETEGRIMSYQPPSRQLSDNEIQSILTDIKAISGSSGSAAFLKDTGEVIGTLQGSAISHSGSLTEEINYLRPSKYIWRMLSTTFGDRK